MNIIQNHPIEAVVLASLCTLGPDLRIFHVKSPEYHLMESVWNTFWKATFRITFTTYIGYQICRLIKE